MINWQRSKTSANICMSLSKVQRGIMPRCCFYQLCFSIEQVLHFLFVLFNCIRCVLSVQTVDKFNEIACTFLINLR